MPEFPEFKTFSLADSVGRAQDILASRQAMDNRAEMLQMEKEDRASRAQRQHMELFGKMAAGIMSQFDSLPPEQQTDETFHSLVQRQAEALRPYDPVSADRMAQGADRQAVASVARMYGFTPRSEATAAKVADIQATEGARLPFDVQRMRLQSESQFNTQSALAGVQNDYAKGLKEMEHDLRLNEQAAQAGHTADLEKLKESGKLGEHTAALRKEWNGLKPVQDYTSVLPAVRSARDAMTRDDKAADLNIVYAFAKTMDPGSVVRESETQMTASTGSPAEQAVGMFNSIVGGARLTADVRKKLLAEIESRAKEYENVYKSYEGNYRGIAASAGMDPRQIFTDLGGAPPQAPQAAPPGRKTYDVQNVQPQQDGSTIAVIDGQKLKFPPGQFEAWRQSHGLQ